ASIDDDIAHIDAHAEFNPVCRRDLRIAFDHAALNLGSTAQRINHTGKLDQHAVAGGLHDPATVLVDLRIDEVSPMHLQAGKRALLVGAHHPAIADNIGGKDSG